jgi:CheY-like chemotaxis protein
MVYGFVKQSHGHIGILSTPGQGTTVRLYLPRYQNDGSDGAAPNVLVSALPSPSARHKGTILVVDDEPMLRVILNESLTDLGYVIHESSDGASALKILQSFKTIDLLVTDVGLTGGMNGRQLADAARVILPKLPVLFITGYAESSMMAKGGLGPRMEVITKPFGLGALAERVRTMI